MSIIDVEMENLQQQRHSNVRVPLFFVLTDLGLKRFVPNAYVISFFLDNFEAET